MSILITWSLLSSIELIGFVFSITFLLSFHNLIEKQNKKESSEEMKRSRINSDSVYTAVMRSINTDTRMDTFQIFCCINAEYQFIPRLVSRSHTHIQKNYELAGLSRILNDQFYHPSTRHSLIGQIIF